MLTSFGLRHMPLLINIYSNDHLILPVVLTKVAELGDQDAAKLLVEHSQ